jgi:chemosensory pili system protein ChpA (sensor histidine kinase/response regulator)
VTSELQDGLMQTRMVPFQRHVSRLQRIVRQAAGETGKAADLVVEGGGMCRAATQTRLMC